MCARIEGHEAKAKTNAAASEIAEKNSRRRSLIRLI